MKKIVLIISCIISSFGLVSESSAGEVCFGFAGCFDSINAIYDENDNTKIIAYTSTDDEDHSDDNDTDNFNEKGERKYWHITDTYYPETREFLYTITTNYDGGCHYDKSGNYDCDAVYESRNLLNESLNAYDNYYDVYKTSDGSIFKIYDYKGNLDANGIGSFKLIDSDYTYGYEDENGDFVLFENEYEIVTKEQNCNRKNNGSSCSPWTTPISSRYDYSGNILSVNGNEITEHCKTADLNGNCTKCNGESLRLVDGVCNHYIYTPAEAAPLLHNDNTNEVTITFKK